MSLVLHNLVMAAGMVCLTVVIHFVGLIVLLRLMEYRAPSFRPRRSYVGRGALLVCVVLGLFAIHTVQIFAYAFAFMAIGAIGPFEEALYFSTTNFTSLGYGDLTLGPDWRLFGAIEGANGLILIGWSSAFLISVTSQMRPLEKDWLGKPELMEAELPLEPPVEAEEKK